MQGTSESGKAFSHAYLFFLDCLMNNEDHQEYFHDMIIEEWADITKKIEANIQVIDFPLLDTRTEDKNLIGKFISDIVLQVLSFVAQNERENIKQRQAEGIRIAREKGIKLGRPQYKLPNNFEEVARKYHNKEITNVKAAEFLKMNRCTFLKYAKQYK